MLAANASPNYVVTEDQEMPLHVAAKEGDEGICKLIALVVAKMLCCHGNVIVWTYCGVAECYAFLTTYYD